jgi:hypothetical protein
MRWSRFLLHDGLGIVLLVPLLTWLGYTSAGLIEEMIETVQKVERGLLWGSIAGTLVLAGCLWWWRRRRQLRQRSEMKEAFVQPQKPIQGPAGSSPEEQSAEKVAGDTPPSEIESDGPTGESENPAKP